MATRSDHITQLGKLPELFSDLTTAFSRHPVTGALARVTNADSVRQSIRNIVLTDIGERPFKPHVGSNVRSSLFSNFGPFTSENVVTAIRDAIRHNEPRANIISIVPYDAQRQYAIGVTITFSIINSPEPIVLDLIIADPQRVK